HEASKRRMSYGEIATFAKVPAELPEIKPEQLKPAKQFRLLGNDVQRIDMAEKSSGRLMYASDVQVSGMLYGIIARAPVRGSGPTSFNSDELKAMPGIVEVVPLDYGVGIVGNTVEAVFAARRALKAQWRDAKGSSINTEKDRQDYLANVRDLKK